MRLAGIIALLMLAALGLAQSFGRPVHRVWTVWAGPELNVRSVTGGVVYYTSRYEAGSIDLHTGQLRWRASIYNEKAKAIPIGEGLLAREDRSALELRLGSAISGWPLSLQDNRLVCEDGGRIVCYAPGTPAPPPADASERKQVGRQLAEKFAELDAEGERKLFALGKEAAAPLLRKLLTLAREFESDRSDARAGYLETSIHSGTDMLEHMREHLSLEQLDAAIAECKGKGWMGFRLEVISQRINRSMERLAASVKLIQDGMIPIKGSYDEDGSDKHEFAKRVFRSPHPEVVRLAEQILNDPEARFYYRCAAFEVLGGAGAQGMEAIKRARASYRPSQNWKQLFDRHFETKSVLGEGKSPDGRTWQLTRNVVFGNHYDLFIREKIGEGFGDPIFLDVKTNVEPPFRTKRTEVYLGVPVADLIRSGWIQAFVNKPDTRTDTDGDGLTDLAENRLGTNAKSADTDGDGTRDSEDMCPNAAGGPRTEQQKVVAAAVEARFRFGGQPPGILTVDDIQPFEVTGYGSYLMWSSTGKSGTLKDQFENGVQLVRVGRPQRRDGRRSTGLVEFSCNGKRARIEIVNALGGLHAIWHEVVLEKVGDEWFVVEMLMTGQA